jgi:hypothetical protein
MRPRQRGIQDFCTEKDALIFKGFIGAEIRRKKYSVVWLEADERPASAAVGVAYRVTFSLPSTKLTSWMTSGNIAVHRSAAARRFQLHQKINRSDKIAEETSVFGLVRF